MDTGTYDAGSVTFTKSPPFVTEPYDEEFDRWWFALPDTVVYVQRSEINHQAAIRWWLDRENAE
jgi:hypothetical protein